MTQATGRILRMSYLAASVAGAGFFVLSVAWLGVWPARQLAEQARLTGPATPLVRTESEARGRAIYAREGCAYCHTQQIRATNPDVARFGATTMAWETRADIPHVMGTRRIGPDLSRVSETRPEDWQLTHLYAPRSVVPLSVMPAYPYLFDGGPDAPTQAARDLVAYLETLGRARRLAAPEGDETLNVHPAKTRRSGAVPELSVDSDAALGAELYADHCAACHGREGAGDGPGAAGLRPRPANLMLHQYRASRLGEALWNGVAGTSMPAWRDRSIADLSAIAAHVQRLAVPGMPPRPFGADTVSPTAEERELGSRVYAANCAQCHGVQGAGDGSAVSQLAIVPTNFQRQRPMFDEALRVLRNGIDGTPMAPWTSRLNESELTAVAHYVREFFAQ
jgi:mono/diheme cytochrome c family protein